MILSQWELFPSIMANFVVRSLPPMSLRLAVDSNTWLLVLQLCTMQLVIRTDRWCSRRCRCRPVNDNELYSTSNRLTERLQTTDLVFLMDCTGSMHADSQGAPHRMDQALLAALLPLAATAATHVEHLTWMHAVAKLYLHSTSHSTSTCSELSTNDVSSCASCKHQSILQLISMYRG